MSIGHPRLKEMASLLMCLWFSFMCVVSGGIERNHWGNEFVIPFLSNFEKSGTVYIYMMSKTNSSIYIEIPWQNRQEFLTVPPNSHASVSLPWDIRYEVDLTIMKKAVYINSSNPITVYTLNYKANSASSTLVIPVDVLGDHYMTVSYFRSGYNTSVVVAAVEDDTEVTFHYHTNGGYCSPQAFGTGQTSTHIINRLDVIGVHCTKDLTGTTVTSNKPVSVVSGNVGAKVPVSKGGKDIVEEMMLSIKDLGTEYVLTNAGRLAGTINRLVAVEDNTVIKSSTGDVYSLMKSQFVDTDTNTDGEHCIQSTKPILAVAFGKGVRANADSLGDPLMVIIPPVGRFHYDYFIDFDISRHIGAYKGSQYLSVVGSLKDIPYLEGDLSASHTSIPNCNYSVIHKQVTTWPLVIDTENTTRSAATLFAVSPNYNGFGMPLGMVFVPQYCWTSTCKNNGTCVETNGSFVCHCDVGYTGETCQNAIVTETATDISSRNVQQLTTEMTDIPSSFWTVPQTQHSSILQNMHFSHSLLSTDNEVLSSGMASHTEPSTQLLESTISSGAYTNQMQTGSVSVEMDISDENLSSEFTVQASDSFNHLMMTKETINNYDSTSKFLSEMDSLAPSFTNEIIASSGLDTTNDFFDGSVSISAYETTDHVLINPNDTIVISSPSVTMVTLSDISLLPTTSIVKPDRTMAILSSLSSKAISLRSARVIFEVCKCLCKGSRLEVLNASVVKEVTDKIQQELLLDTKSLSKTIRRYTSAPDHRKSAQGVGALGIAILAFTFGVCVISDSLSVFHAVYKCYKRR